MNKFILRQSCLLFLTALIWGVAFVAQSAGMDYVEPFTFNAVRSILGGIVLIPCIAFLTYWKKKRAAGAVTAVDVGSAQNGQRDTIKEPSQKKLLYMGGIVCGILLCVASNFQQVGIQYTTVGKAGFITALYIIIVPILGIFLHRRAGAKVWCGVFFALCGLYLLCMQSELRLEKGDALVLVCAVTFSFHIMVVDYFSPKVDGVKMACIQFFVCGILSAVGMFLFEKPDITQILAAWLPILYAGVMSCGVAYTLQIVAQEGMNPTVASLILSMESVVSVLAGWVILGETLSRRELMGCLLMMVAIILAQLPDKKRKKPEQDR
ncbi:MAG: DMT family transporter [Blautia sp.]|nr:DMT family transporter [Lachnoclostridium sp.]MCM1212442.1 DMT family transporter [Blautia sp.]